jgi:hypothetical protein
MLTGVYITEGSGYLILNDLHYCRPALFSAISVQRISITIGL